VRLSHSQAVSLIQRVLMTLVLRLIMNGGFSFDSANRAFRVLPGFMGKSLVIAVRRSTKRNNKTRSCTSAKRIYIWQLLSSYRAPVTRVCVRVYVCVNMCGCLFLLAFCESVCNRLIDIEI